MSRFEAIDAEDMASRNPKVDLKQVRNFDKALRELRAAGIEPKKFELAPPFRPMPRAPISRRKRGLFDIHDD